MKLVEISDKYIEYMKMFFKKNILDNKLNQRKHSRKYLGIVLKINNYNYFAPLSSPKESDFKDNGDIKKSNLIIIRMVKSTKFCNELLGTIKLNNMLPVPSNQIIDYSLEKELDENYKNLIIDELEWIQKNTTYIKKTAKTLYFIKKNEDNHINIKNKKFFESIIPFTNAEYQCDLYEKNNK